MRKLVFSITILLIILIPFKVNGAETIKVGNKICTLNNNYYIFSFAASGQEDGIDSDNILNRVDTATFKNTIPSNAVIYNSEIGYPVENCSPKQFTDIMFKILQSDGLYKKSSYESWLVHNVDFFFWKQKFSDGTEYSYYNLSTTLREQLQNDFQNSVSFISNNPNYGLERKVEIISRTSSSIKFEITRDIDMSYVPDYCNLNMEKYYQSLGITQPAGCYMIVPLSYNITYYDPSECYEEENGNDNEEVKSYTITYNPNGGIGNKYVESIKENTRYTILDNNEINNSFTKDGYVFIGWSTNKNATQPDRAYDPGDIYNVTDNLNLYAVWSNNIKEYKVTYHSNDGTNNILGPFEIVEGGTHKIKTNTFTRDGYTFVGWSKNNDATQSDATFSPDKTYKITDNLDLYAVWVKTSGSMGNNEESPNTGIGYSITIISVIFITTIGGVLYFKRKNKFENI